VEDHEGVITGSKRLRMWACADSCVANATAVTLWLAPHAAGDRYNRARGAPVYWKNVKSMTIETPGQGAAVPDDDTLDRRGVADRRKQPLRALLYGSFNPRRRGSRRGGERRVSSVDWHDPQWLAVAMLIVLFSCVDAFLTLTLIDHGAYEVNPVMAPLVRGSALAFAMVKIGLTAGGVVLLTLLARMKAFGRVPVGLLLYTVLFGYGALLVYEFRLLQAALPF
jgi:hypothetical protein